MNEHDNYYSMEAAEVGSWFSFCELDFAVEKIQQGNLVSAIVQFHTIQYRNIFKREHHITGLVTRSVKCLPRTDLWLQKSLNSEFETS